MQTVKEVNDRLEKVLTALEEEKKQRVELEGRLTKSLESFESQLNTVKVVFKAKIHELEVQLEKEREQKQQIVSWIKTTVGPSPCFADFRECISLALPTFRFGTCKRTS